MTLPRSTSTTNAGAGTKVYVTKKGLYIGEPPVKLMEGPRESGSFPPRYKPMTSSFVLSDLKPKLAGASEVLVYADRGIAMDAIREVVYTAASADVKLVDLMVQTDGGVRAVPITIPNPRPDCSRAAVLAPLPSGAPSGSVAPPAASASVDPRCNEAAVRLAVLVIRNGLIVKGAGQSVGPGCELGKPGTTLPSSKDGFDVAGLRACVTKVRGAVSGANDRDVLIAPAPPIPFGDFISIADALRFDEKGSELFPEVHLAVL
jgi:hypothetical protein